MGLMNMKQVGWALGWCIGIILAGSDGSYMPWPNLVGLLSFIISSWKMGKNYAVRQHTDLHHIKGQYADRLPFRRVKKPSSYPEFACRIANLV
jgi:hypothetical protein